MALEVALGATVGVALGASLPPALALALAVALGGALETALSLAVGEACDDEWEAELLAVAPAQPAHTKARTAVSTRPLRPTLPQNDLTASTLQMNRRCDSAFGRRSWSNIL